MKTTIDKILTHVYELEGLLLVMKRRNGDVPQEVVDRCRSVAAVLGQETQEMAVTAAIASRQQPLSPQVPQKEPKPAVKPAAVVPQSPVKAAPAVKAQAPSVPEPAPAVDKAINQDKKPTITFSINDRFLFTRELFNNDPSQFDAAIEKIKSFTQVSQLQDFAVKEMQWDMSLESVNEFLRLVGVGLKNNSNQ